MKKTVKNFKLIVLSLVVLLCATIFAGFNIQFNVAYAMDLKFEDDLSIVDIFSDRQIESSGYLYNYDDSADYIYVEFSNNSGYAILADETLELLEYSFSGNLPYANIAESKYYYGGPNRYLIKNDGIFTDVVTNEAFSDSSIDRTTCAENIRESFSINKNDEKKLKSTAEIQSALKTISKTKLNTASTVPPIDENNLISPTDGATYINNAEYFLTKGAYPRHGINSKGSCVTVATQLLLSYNNYYNDRRIIAPEYLYGGWNASVDNDVLNPENYNYPYESPNACAKPNTKTSFILGSTQAYHDYLYDNGVTDYVSYNGANNAAKNLKPLLNQRNIDYTLDGKHTNGSVAIGSTDIINELNQGRPLVLATTQFLNGTPYENQREFNHAVIAYGYQTLAPYAGNSQSYLGYIVHMGYDNYATGNKVNVWTNSAWYFDYMTLKINHTHKYSIILEDNNEARCEECGHRTSAFRTKDIGNNCVQITGNVLLNGDLVLPEIIDGKNVTEIGSWAFANCTTIHSVTIPATVKTIGRSAFQNCTGLSYAYLAEGSNLTEIGDSAFASSGICTMEFPAKLKKISARCFQDTYIVSFSFSEGAQLEAIGDSAFEDCKSLYNYKIPSTVTSIGARAFANCTQLTIAGSSRNLEYIGKAAYLNCEALSTFKLYDELLEIGDSAFQNCINLLSVGVNVTSKLEHIGNSAFEGCTTLPLFRFPLSLKTIGDRSFKDTLLAYVLLLDNLLVVGNDAFTGCNILTMYISSGAKVANWGNGWNNSDRPMVWGCQVDFNTLRITSLVKSKFNPIIQNSEDVVSNPRETLTDDLFDGWYTTDDFSGNKYERITDAPNGTLYAKWKEPSSCIAEGTMITLADGSQVAVENLKGDEQLLVWNMLTGTFDSAPILFIDSDPRCENEVINLSFSDGTSVKVISEHAFWDFDLNEYVFLRSDASKYIGHWFNKQITNADGELEWTRVQLSGVELTREITKAWSPVTCGHLCYYVNGMLSMPGATEGLINIFDIDADTMRIDEVAFARDIEAYGLFTYDEFSELLPVPEYVFYAFGGQYLKVAIGKGITSIEELAALIQRYEKFFE